MGLALATLAGVTVLVALVSEVFVESVQKAAEAFGMTPAFVGFIVVALVGGAAEMASAFSGARKNRLDLSVGIALGSASQIALFVAPVLVLLSYVIGPTPMDLQFWPGAVVMILIATLTASLVTNSGRSAWSGSPTRSHPGCPVSTGSTRPSCHCWCTRCSAQAASLYWDRIPRSPPIILAAVLPLSAGDPMRAVALAGVPWRSSLGSSASWPVSCGWALSPSFCPSPSAMAT